MDLTNASVIVTGGASGLGAATCRRLAETAATVVVADVDADRGREVASDVGGVFAEMDVLDTDAVVHAVESARAHAPLRALVCCAGISRAKRTVSLREDRLSQSRRHLQLHQDRRIRDEHTGARR